MSATPRSRFIPPTTDDRPSEPFVLEEPEKVKTNDKTLGKRAESYWITVKKVLARVIEEKAKAETRSRNGPQRSQKKHPGLSEAKF